MSTRSMRAKNVGPSEAPEMDVHATEKGDARHHAHLDAGGKQQGLQKGKEKLVELCCHLKRMNQSVIARCKVEGREWKRTASKEGIFHKRGSWEEPSPDS
ncbi:hypothetical protein ACLOJK_038816 [Asimina triloba]